MRRRSIMPSKSSLCNPLPIMSHEAWAQCEQDTAAPVKLILKALTVKGSDQGYYNIQINQYTRLEKPGHHIQNGTVSFGPRMLDLNMSSFRLLSNKILTCESWSALAPTPQLWLVGGVGSESVNWQLTKHGGTWGDELREIIQVWFLSHSIRF